MTGYFGTDRPEELVGLAVDRGTMFREAMANCEAVAVAIYAGYLSAEKGMRIELDTI